MSKTMLVLQPLPLIDVPPPPPAPTNEALMAAIQRHDPEAFWMLYRRHAELIRSVVARSVSDEDQCDDVVREVFEEIRDRAAHYTAEKGRVLGWMITLARRRAADRVRALAAAARLAPARKPRAKSAATNGRRLARFAGMELRGLRDWLRGATA
jgi:DNA-directed RNA polymerase specialized sigma24 family protein